MRVLSFSLLAALSLLGCSSSDSSREVGAPDSADVVATDPVSLADVSTDSPWNTYWDGHWYYFESRENQRQFESSPTSYVREDGRERPQRYKVQPSQVR
jgi:YHS domain-containing protein